MLPHPCHYLPQNYPHPCLYLPQNYPHPCHYLPQNYLHPCHYLPPRWKHNPILPSSQDYTLFIALNARHKHTGLKKIQL